MDDEDEVDKPDEVDRDEGPEFRENDPAFVEACDVLTQFFESNNRDVFYHRQLTVLFEKKWFHWITGRALTHLVELGTIATSLETIPDLEDENGAPLTLRLYRHPSNRYWQRQKAEIATLVHRFSVELGHSLGKYGEILCDAGLGGVGFSRAAKNVNEWKGKKWERSGHNLDRIYVKDGLEYGCEIKNTLKYLPTPEREIKVELAKHLGLIPLFVVRWLPKDHFYKVVKAGGNVILFEQQLYPVGQEALAAEVRSRLGLPARCLDEFPADAVARLLGVHEKRLGRR